MLEKYVIKEIKIKHMAMNPWWCTQIDIKIQKISHLHNSCVITYMETFWQKLCHTWKLSFVGENGKSYFHFIFTMEIFCYFFLTRLTLLGFSSKHSFICINLMFLTFYSLETEKCKFCQRYFCYFLINPKLI